VEVLPVVSAELKVRGKLGGGGLGVGRVSFVPRVHEGIHKGYKGGREHSGGPGGGVDSVSLGHFDSFRL